MDSHAQGDEEDAKHLHPDTTARVVGNKVQQKEDGTECFRAFKHTSAQRFDLIHRLLPRLKQQSEDCLFMNLFVPERLGRG